MITRYCQERVSFRLRPERIHFPAGTTSELSRQSQCPHRRRLRCFVQRDKGRAPGQLPEPAKRKGVALEPTRK
jgi:hypothetical protein